MPPPAAPGGDAPRTRASDADREGVLDRLRAASVDGQLSFDELAERAGLAAAALTRGELDAVVADLGASTAVRLTAPSVPAPPSPSFVEDHRTLLAFTRHTGRRAMAARCRFAVRFGNVHLDLRDVVIPGPRLDLEVRAVCGWVQVVVPEGIEVRFEGDGVLTNREVHLRAVPVPPGAPEVVIHVGGFLGSVSVRSRPRRGPGRGRRSY